MNLRRMLMGSLLMLAVVVVPAGAERAWACSCALRTDAEAFEWSGAVFLGELVDRREPKVTLSSADQVRLVFAVERVFKGEVHATQSVVTAADGASCGLEIRGSGPHLVFGRPNGSRTEIDADLCGGTRTMGRDPIPEAFGVGTTPIAGSSSIGSDRSGLLIVSAAGLVAIGLLTGAIAIILWAYRRARRPRPAI